LRVKISEDVLYEDYGASPHDANLLPPTGKQVGTFTENLPAESWRKTMRRNVDSNDKRTAKITQKNPLNQEDEQTPKIRLCRTVCVGLERSAKSDHRKGTTLTPGGRLPSTLIRSISAFTFGIISASFPSAAARRWPRPRHRGCHGPECPTSAGSRRRPSRHLSPIPGRRSLLRNHILNVINLVAFP